VLIGAMMMEMSLVPDKDNGPFTMFELRRNIIQRRGGYNKAPSPDMIIRQVLKECINGIAPHLAEVTNACRKLSYFPRDWKVEDGVTCAKPDKKHLIYIMDEGAQAAGPALCCEQDTGRYDDLKGVVADEERELVPRELVWVLLVQEQGWYRVGGGDERGAGNPPRAGAGGGPVLRGQGLQPVLAPGGADGSPGEGVSGLFCLTSSFLRKSQCNLNMNGFSASKLLRRGFLQEGSCSAHLLERTEQQGGGVFGGGR